MAAEPADFVVDNLGSIVTVTPLSQAAQIWMDENVVSEPWQWTGGSLAVDPRYASDLVSGMRSEGLLIQ